MKKILQHAMSLMLLACSFTFTSCFKNFYTVKTDRSYTNLETTLKDRSKRVIVHYTDKNVELKSPTIDVANIQGTINPYTPAKPQYGHPNEKKRLQVYKFKHRNTLFNEVHVYTNILKPTESSLALIKKDEVVKYNTYKPARGASTGSHVLGVFLVTTAVFVVVSTIGLASTFAGFSAW
jgi:hypothetical protein